MNKKTWAIGVLLVALCAVGILYAYYAGESLTKSVSMTVSIPPPHPRTSMLKGVNLAGAEFNDSAIPGVYGSDYSYPTNAEVDYFTKKGMNAFRLPFLWERLQPQLNQSFTQAELDRIDAFVNYATGKGAYVDLDVHNYGLYRGKEIGTVTVPTSSFADLWSRLATRYKGNNHIIFGLMNEPGVGMAVTTTTQWRAIAQAALTAIRNAGANNLVLIPGTVQNAGDWTDWHDIDSKSNADVFATRLIDPANNNMIEIHQYFDADASGSSEACQSTTIGVESLQPFTTWLRQAGQHAFLGEFGASANSVCLSALDNTLAHMDANTDVWAGWTYWAAGPMWGEYMFTVEPTDAGADRPQMRILQKHF